MNYTLLVHPERISYLENELKDRITVIGKTERDMIEVIIKIDHSLDILSVFHAGIKYGLKY
jgi:hypothetical protein